MLATATTTTDSIQAHIIRGRLEAEGLHPSVAFEHHIRMNWFISNALGGVRVQVPPSEQEQALVIVNRINDKSYQQLLEEQEETQDDLVCPACDSKDVTRSRFTESLALVLLWFLMVPVPFQTGAYNCRSCKHHWVSQAGKGNRVGLLTLAIFVALFVCSAIAIIFLAIIRFIFGYLT